MGNNNGRALTPVAKLKNVMASESVQEQFKNAMNEKKDLFIASLIDLYASDTYLQNCEPNQVVMEALKAATLNLPINKSLGFAYIVPYKKSGKQIPQFQMGYKGMIQLAMRTGQYSVINADVVYEGEYQGFEKLTGKLDISGDKKSDKVVGYFAHIETVNGFKKTMYMTVEDMQKHGKKYSKSYDKDFSPWKTEFDGMAKKTMLRALLGKYGIMTVEMADGLAKDENDNEADYTNYANSEIIDVEPPKNIDMKTGEVTDPEDQQEEEPPVPPETKQEELPGFAQ